MESNKRNRGLFQISAFACPGKTLEEIEKEINLELERIKKEPPTAEEMERSLNGRESQFINGLGSVLGKGAQLSNYAGYLKKPNYFQADLDRYRKVTASDVQRVANQYLNSNRLVMAYVPGAPASKPNAESDKPASSVETTAVPDKDPLG